ncbi:MAG: DNA cytosine methyltransferase, partial [Kiritimatiellae bacterium]|nr:DNA cytosine methyltransferase [Kiritimatiellia bacterium]
MTIGSVCSGIEAASVAWGSLGVDFAWFSEIAPFQARFLAAKYPDVPNVGDLCLIPEKIGRGEVPAADVICGGTPCQAFSLTGHMRGLEDERGRLTLKFIEVADANDKARGRPGLIFWENVEGVLKDKTNAFGCFISGLAGCDSIIQLDEWPNAGLVRGKKRNIAWRVLDAKYFGVPQQRKRLYLVAGGRDFHPECVLFELHEKRLGKFKEAPLAFEKGGKSFEVFREYTDCLYSAYGTKWNGNAAAYNGSLYVAENERLRRMSPLECERLMGFPDNYTDVPFA